MNAKIIQPLTALTVAATLSGCGLISNIIGEQTINDPFGIDNQKVSIALSENAAANLAVQAEGAEGTTFTFDDQDINMHGFGGDYIKSEIGFAPKATVSKPLGPEGYPSEFTVTDMTVTLTLSDEGGEGGAERTVETMSTLDGNLIFDKGADCAPTNLSCDYTYDETSGVVLAKALLLELGVKKETDEKLKKAIEIIRLEGEASPNTATVTFEVTTASDPDLAGSTITVTLKEGKSVFKP